MRPVLCPRRLSSLVLVLVALAAGTLAAAETASAPAATRPRVEVVFCLDTTGSMGGLLAGAQAKIWSIVNGIATAKPVPEIKVGLVGYRDRGDAYITQLTDLTADLDAIHTKLFGLQAGGGGDGPESVNQALHEAVHKMSWSPKGPKVYRVIFLVGDAEPHMDYPQDILYPDICKQAVERDIVVNTIRCGDDAGCGKHWQQIADRAEGRFTTVAQSGGVQVVSTPFDARLAELSGKLVGTSVYAGSADKRERAEAAAKKAIAASEEAAGGGDASALAVEADKGEFRARSAAAACDSAGPAGAAGGMGMGSDVGEADLLGEFAREGGKALEKVKETDLSEEMRKMTPAERQALLEKKLAERKAIQDEIDATSKKRAEFLREESRKKGSGDTGFDAVVLQMLKEQGSKRGLTYEDSK